MDLQGARRERRLEMYRARLAERLRTNRAAVEALYEGGTLFSPQGTRSGRALLRAHQVLQRASSLLEQLSGDGVVPAPRLPERIEELYREVDTLLARSDALSGRHHRAASVARLPGR
ncbi:hypothetical protein [Archangium sp.]|uniref:hypothetical protein n=1 Tax=Archangium sp. TaxID=1872627 RepID=UPI0039C89FD6